MSHELKVYPQFFKALWAGVKTFEIRKNDRKFELNDEICLQEFVPTTQAIEEFYTGREINGFITYITDFEQKKGYVVFGFSESHRHEE